MCLWCAAESTLYMHHQTNITRLASINFLTFWFSVAVFVIMPNLCFGSSMSNLANIITRCLLFCEFPYML